MTPSSSTPQFNKFLCYDAWFLTFPTSMLMLANLFPLSLLWPLLNPSYRRVYMQSLEFFRNCGDPLKFS